MKLTGLMVVVLSLLSFAAFADTARLSQLPTYECALSVPNDMQVEINEIETKYEVVAKVGLKSADAKQAVVAALDSFRSNDEINVRYIKTFGNRIEITCSK